MAEVYIIYDIRKKRAVDNGDYLHCILVIGNRNAPILIEKTHLKDLFDAGIPVFDKDQKRYQKFDEMFKFR